MGCSLDGLTQELIKALWQGGPIPSELNEIPFQANPRMPQGTIRLMGLGVAIDGVELIHSVEFSPSVGARIHQCIHAGEQLSTNELVDVDDLDTLFAKIDEVCEDD